MEPSRGKSIWVPCDRAEPSAACVVDPARFRQPLTEVSGQPPALVLYLYAADNSLGMRMRYNPPVSLPSEGGCHDSIPLLLPAGGLGTPVAVCHAARCLAQPMRDGTVHASQAHPGAASTLQGAQAVCRPHPQAPLCPVCARDNPSPALASRAT
jgi:hypothetical protein